MKNNLLHYKGYYGSVEYSAEDHVFFGKIEYINDLVTFEATDVDGLHQAFQDAVDQYLARCEQLQRAPQKTFKGRFNVRIAPELHKQASLVAAQHHISLNKLVEQAISHEVARYDHSS
ncbi:toxin-antitoxin system HicB family antitoxin [candidate division KSB3 bacterium]|uniref:Toxin-antitoxin system HicB family antitoxin n=1 Tax=candidate division KSB3 bacterium TaxID=2044937 RepID=A0A9D5JSR5_9BACT|nr:toxin-antitoxin system HicB family antitoxin [candidate division KSB3 bacterium]MBD3323568.1 toxin-antitoxin system HicB family antitoxin [candidate division KSB3 bacterium]